MTGIQVKSERKILVVGPAWVGDMVMSQSMYILLKNIFPDRTIDVLAPAWANPLLSRMPEVSRAIESPFGHGDLKLRQRRELGLSMRGIYDQAIILPKSFKSALIPWWAKIKHRTGFTGEMRFPLINDIRSLDRRLLPRTVDRYATLALQKDERVEDVPQPHLQIDTANTERSLERLNLKLDKPVLALMPGSAFGPSKRWPAKNFAAVATHYLERDWQVWILGSSTDSAVGQDIEQQVSYPIINLCGNTSLIEVVDLLAKTTLAVTNDSGLMHIAAAVGVPLISIYGSTSPDFNPPLTEHSSVVWKAIECSPCYQRKCRYKHYRCMNEILPLEVLNAAQQLEKINRNE